MELKTFYAEGISHFSYMILADEQSVVIDPQRDIEDYLRTAAEWQAPITHILVTHNHADFAAGQLRLHQATGAPILMGESADVAHEFQGVREGDRVAIGSVELRIMETPGHTPEHVSYVLTDRDASEAPLAVFSGDSLFSGDVGRPDLFGPDTQKELTRKLFETMGKYRSLPDGTLVYPAHGAGSLCGKRVGQRNPTSIGYEKQANPMLKAADFDAFKAELLSAIATPPAYYFATAKKNASGSGLDRPYTPPGPLTTTELEDLEGMVLDLRDQAGFAAGHIPGSLNTVTDVHFSLLIGFAIDPAAKLALVGSPGEVAKASRTLYRMGYDHVEGFLAGEIDAWRKQARLTASFSYLGPKESAEWVKSQQALLLDVRTESEWAEERIPGAKHVPLAQLRDRLEELPGDRTIIVQCGHGCRGSLTASILRTEGFTDVANLAGGILGWKAAGLAVETYEPSPVAEAA